MPIYFCGCIRLSINFLLNDKNFFAQRRNSQLLHLKGISANSDGKSTVAWMSNTSDHAKLPVKLWAMWMWQSTEQIWECVLGRRPCSDWSVPSHLRCTDQHPQTINGKPSLLILTTSVVSPSELLNHIKI